MAGARAALNVPMGPAATGLPSRSRTWLACIVMVYVPLSAAFQEPPGGIIEYVAVRGVPLLFTLTETNVASAEKPFGPLTRTLLLPSVDTSMATLSAYVTVKV